jgi:hypothetical protein
VVAKGDNTPEGLVAVQTNLTSRSGYVGTKSPLIDFAARCAQGEIDGGQGRNRTTDTRILAPT